MDRRQTAGATEGQHLTAWTQKTTEYPWIVEIRTNIIKIVFDENTHPAQAIIRNTCSYCLP